jgi:transcriptional regulator with XRE-family HTH domain
MKSTLGQVLKRQRKLLWLSQAELARRVGVKPSHVAYLEKDHRRPSLALLSRLGDVLGLGKESLFRLACPEASALIGEHKKPSCTQKRNQAWASFVSNKGLLTRYQVTPQELKVLSQVNLLGKVSEPRHFLFILNAIRQAVDEE